MDTHSRKRKTVNHGEGELSVTNDGNTVAEDGKGSQPVDSVENEILQRPNPNAGRTPAVQPHHEANNLQHLPDLGEAVLNYLSSGANLRLVSTRLIRFHDGSLSRDQCGLSHLCTIISLSPGLREHKLEACALQLPSLRAHLIVSNNSFLVFLEVIAIAGAVVNKRILNFVQNLRKAKIESDVLTVPDCDLLGGRRELSVLRGRLLVRQCYRELKNAIFKISDTQVSADGYSNDFLVMGNVGIGKSMFVYYMIYELMQLKKTIVWQYSNDSQKAVLITPTSLSFADDICTFQRDLAKATTWYIVDDRPPIDADAITLLVASPDRTVWKHFVKGNVETRYMPIWSREEINMMKPRGMAFARSESGVKELEDSVIQEQYRVWGGIPRYVFQKALVRHVNKSMERAVNGMDIEQLYRYIGETDGWDESHVGIHMTVKIDCAEEIRYQDYVMDFVSAYARELILSRARQLSNKKVKQFITLAAGCRSYNTAAAFR